MTDQSVSERKRHGILDAARTVFSRQGYDRASVEDVAGEAGVAKGTLYLYFKSKEELYLAALARDLTGLAHKARAEMDRVPTLREKMLAFLRVRLEYAKANEDFLRIYLAEYGSVFVKSSLHSELGRVSRENMRFLKNEVEQAAARREIRAVEAGPVTAALSAMSRGMLEIRLLGWKEFQTRDEAEFAVDLLWRGIGLEGKPAGRNKRREARNK
jgi:TetR/AcrR family transcriptional regulator, fatty acid metabolism regulator protein